MKVTEILYTDHGEFQVNISKQGDALHVTETIDEREDLWGAGEIGSIRNCD